MSVPAQAVREVAVAQARALARAGRYAEAEELLEGEDGSVVLDLKARMYAQQGRLDEADRCWAGVAALSPGDPGAAEGRRRIARIRATAASPRRFVLARSAFRLGTASVVLLAFVMLADVWLDRDETGAPPRPSSPVVPSAAGSPDPIAALKLEGQGMRIVHRADEIEVTFERGLFRRDATLTSRGRATLKDLGEQLRPYAAQISVTVIGHTDRRAVHPGGGYASNAELGLLRATVVREVLRSSARIPTARFSVSTLAGLLPPHPGEAASGDPRNRTVSVRISAAGGR
ncbi:flagellar motor protein MotB [Actinomadura sp. 3N508]|uniref:flagellar motor protein MotB n=1 Tax=Actinomadura sp. 3N508 TaxID=3375153 RepID=UPI0037B3C6A2